MVNKGMEAPVNTLVILAIAVIVLLSVVVFFIGGFTGPSQDLQARNAFNSCASAWSQLGCSEDWTSVTCRDGATLETKAKAAGFTSQEQAKQAVGCLDSGFSGDSGSSGSTGDSSTGGLSGAPTGFEDSGGPN